jgi:pilus assembly protein CpaB
LRGLIVLALALVLALGAVFLVRGYLTGRGTAPQASVNQVAMAKVVAAAVRLKFGDRLSAENLRTIEWPAASVPEGAFKTVDELLKGDPRTVLQPIEPGELVLASKITGPGQRASLSAVIAEGMRAMTIRVNDVLGVAGFVLPGDHVDLMLTRQLENNDPITDVLLQNVKVLGIDQRSDQSKSDPDVAKAVTIEVTTEQAQKVTLGAKVGIISLALRGMANVELSPSRTISLRDLSVGEAIGTAAAPGSKPATPPVETNKPAVTILRRVDPYSTIVITRGTAAASYKVNPEGVVVTPSTMPSTAPSAAGTSPAPAASGGVAPPPPPAPAATTNGTL